MIINSTAATTTPTAIPPGRDLMIASGPPLGSGSAGRGGGV